MHIGANWSYIFWWGFGKPLLRIQIFIENEKCSPEKVWYLTYLHKNWSQSTMKRHVHDRFFGNCKKIRVSISKMKSSILKNSTVFLLFVDFSTNLDSSAFKSFRAIKCTIKQKKKDLIQTRLRSYLCLHMPNIPTKAAGSIQNSCQASTPDLCANIEWPQNKQTNKQTSPYCSYKL